MRTIFMCDEIEAASFPSASVLLVTQINTFKLTSTPNQRANQHTHTEEAGRLSEQRTFLLPLK